MEGEEEVYIMREEEHYLHDTPGQSPWEIGFDLTDDRGRVYCFQNHMQQQPIESVTVFTGYFRDRLPNGSYVEWLESLGAPVRELYYYVSLRVCTFHHGGHHQPAGRDHQADMRGSQQGGRGSGSRQLQQSRTGGDIRKC